MNNNFIFRKANIRDLKDILRLNFELFKKEYRFDKTLNLNWTYSKEGKKYFKSRIIRKDCFTEVVEYKGRIIGYLSGSIIKRKKLPQGKKVKSEIESLFILKKFRSKGLGTKLVRDFINWSRKNKVDYILIGASIQNKAAIDFYKNFGFKDYSLIVQLKLSKK